METLYYIEFVHYGTGLLEYTERGDNFSVSLCPCLDLLLLLATWVKYKPAWIQLKGLFGYKYIQFLGNGNMFCGGRGMVEGI